MEQNKETYAVIDGVRYGVVYNENDSCGLCAFYNEETGGCNIDRKGLFCSDGFHFEHHKGTETQKGIHKQGYYAFPNSVEAEDDCRYISFSKENGVKYVCRSGRKPGEDEAKDLTKAIHYLKNEIERLKEIQISVDSLIVRNALNAKELDVTKLPAHCYEQEGGEKKFLDVMVDVEALSLRPTAAIIQIAAKVFTLDGSQIKQVTEDKKLEPQFIKNVNATTCAMYGMSFDQDTVDWWSKQETKEKLKVECGETIHYVLSEFNEWLEKWLKNSQADGLMIWTQGTDFDISVLRNAYRVVFGDEKSIPWHFRNVRDARTYFLETARAFEPNVEDPYSIIETKGTVHNALADCDWSIKAVQWAYSKIDRN